MSSNRSIKVWIAAAIIATIFVLSALPKLVGLDMVAESFEEWNYPVEFMYVVGLLELAGATLILIPAVARYGFGILIFVMCGAIVTHVMSGEIAMAVIPLALLVFLAIVATKDKRERHIPRGQVPVVGT